MTLHYSDIENQVDALVAEVGTQFPTARNTPSFYRSILKRPLDILLLVLTAPISVPLILSLALFIWLRTGASPFYTQERIGMGGRVFTMVKLRTMVKDADQRLATFLEENPHAKAEWQRTQKLKDDPRITRTGRILRKTSMDELPQLWNVLIGDMSLVGPRPMMVNQKNMYPGRDYYELRPGLTGFWQVSERNDCSFATRAAHDASYNSNVSITTDLAVIAATVAVVLRGTGY